MSKRVFGLTLLTALLTLLPVETIGAGEIVRGNEVIWQTRPGRSELQWESQVVHLGNGWFGASAYGGVAREVLTLSEKTFWTGGPGDDASYNFGVTAATDLSHIERIKQLTSAGRIREADTLVLRHLCADWWMSLGGLSTIGNLVLAFEGHEGEVHEYKRSLDLKNADLIVEYRVTGVHYRREYFCSYPDRILAIRISGDKPGSVNFTVGLDLMHRERSPQRKVTPATGFLEVSGNMNDNNRPYSVRMHVVNEGGNRTGNDSLLQIQGASAAVIYYTVATGFALQPPLFRGPDPDSITAQVMAHATSAGFGTLRKRHVADYQRLYNRTRLQLENPAKDRESLPTDERLGHFIYRNDVRDIGLKELAFNFGKYMLISVSRPGTMPAGLQGTWNNRYKALWNGTFQLDMNVTQTYMFGNALNLPECQEPFIAYVRMLSEVGARAARAFYGTNGWTSFIISDLWGGVGTLPPAPFFSSGWLALVLWEQYAFERNAKYLREIYPILKGAALFYMENLIEYKNTGKLVLWGTVSAEHSSSPSGVTLPNYQDIAFVAETFENTIKASEILGEDEGFRSALRKAKEQLMPYKIGRLGQLQEWVEDVDDPQCQHRHISHVLALQPCTQINPWTDPALARAIEVTLNLRGDNDFVSLHRPDLGNSVLYPTACQHEGMPFDNFTAQAWSRVARLCTWLRLHDGDRADKIQNDLLRESTLPNMIQYESRAHYGDKPVPDTPFFIESTALAAGYVTEMLLQSQYGELELLPALPAAWASGKVKGLRGRSACTVDIEWKNGKLVRAVITSDEGGKYTVRLKDRVRMVTLQKEVPYMIDEDFWERDRR